MIKFGQAEFNDFMARAFTDKLDKILEAQRTAGELYAENRRRFFTGKLRIRQRVQFQGERRSHDGN